LGVDSTFAFDVIGHGCQARRYRPLDDKQCLTPVGRHTEAGRGETLADCVCSNRGGLLQIRFAHIEKDAHDTLWRLRLNQGRQKKKRQQEGFDHNCLIRNSRYGFIQRTASPFLISPLSAFVSLALAAFSRTSSTSIVPFASRSNSARPSSSAPSLAVTAGYGAPTVKVNRS